MELTQEEIDAVNKLHPFLETRLKDQWIAENILHFKYEHWRDHRNYLGDYKYLGAAWKAMKEHFKDRHVFISDGDGVYEETQWEVLYSGIVYAVRLQLIWGFDDSERYKLPPTPMTAIYGAIVCDMLDNEP